jgi:hypothetical protein
MKRGAAEGLEQLSGSIRERSFEDFYSEIESVARRRPAAVAHVGLLVELAARVAKGLGEVGDRLGGVAFAAVDVAVDQ